VKTIAYGAFLLLLLVASILLLRSIEPARAPAPALRAPSGLGPVVSAIDLGQLSGAGPAELYDLGVDFMQVWRPQEAAALFERAVAADSTFHAAWLELIDCYAHPLVAGEASLAKAAARAARTAPADTGFVAGLRRLYLDHDYAGAIGTLSALMRGDDAPPDARYHVAVAYYRMGRLRDAFKYLDPLLSEDATVAAVVELYIRCAVAAGEFERAADAARELARMYAEEPFPHVLSAQVELARGKHDDAVEYCDHALELDPKCVPAIMTRACLFADAGDFQSARVSFEKLLLFDAPALKSIGHEGVAFVDFLGGDFDAGTAAMDEATRYAMLAGSPARGLSLACRHVEYLCQLGRFDAAESVVQRWVTSFGDIPVRIAGAPIDVARGNPRAAADALARLAAEKDWLVWSRKLSLDVTALTARARIGERRQREAMALLRDEGAAVPLLAAGTLQRRMFLSGYAAFEAGDAESATSALQEARRRLYGVEFPYHGDPVVYVQSLFYLAEAALARGDQAGARAGYEAFLSYWGEASWELEAIARARGRLHALGQAPAPPQG
jgi:tetratricopeptide (TPR) repeat protein